MIRLLPLLLLAGCLSTGAGSETVAPTVTCILTIGDCYDREDDIDTDVETDSGAIVKGSTSIPNHSPLND